MFRPVCNSLLLSLSVSTYSCKFYIYFSGYVSSDQSSEPFPSWRRSSLCHFISQWVWWSEWLWSRWNVTSSIWLAKHSVFHIQWQCYSVYCADTFQGKGSEPAMLVKSKWDTYSKMSINLTVLTFNVTCWNCAFFDMKSALSSNIQYLPRPHHAMLGSTRSEWRTIEDLTLYWGIGGLM